jgi:DNA-binding phage protein
MDIISHIRASGRSVSAVCREANVSRETFYKVIKPGAPARLATIIALAKATGLTPVQIKPELME